MDLILGLFIILYSSILHEIAHGLVAYRLGDPTAKILGRITLNPKSHIDPIMSIMMPLITFLGSGGTFIFGGAKPVPVDPFNLRDGRKDMALVSLAGPLTNITLAIIASLIAHIIFPGQGLFEINRSGLLGLFLFGVMQWNLLLAIFNLLPIPPLDGSKVFSLILSPKQAAAYLSLESIGFMIIMLLFFFPIGGISLMNIVGTLITYSFRFLGY